MSFLIIAISINSFFFSFLFGIFLTSRQFEHNLGEKLFVMNYSSPWVVIIDRSGGGGFKKVWQTKKSISGR
jgi:ABC-type multidrug transport system permease subunit